MKTIKIIDLLNKIANGEEVPEKVKIDGEIYRINGNNNICFMIYEKTSEMCNDDELKLFLNDEVEIIEEEKKLPEKLEPLQKDYMTLDDIKFTFSNSEMILVDKINAILDYLESKEKGE